MRICLPGAGSEAAVRGEELHSSQVLPGNEPLPARVRHVQGRPRPRCVQTADRTDSSAARYTCGHSQVR